MSKLKLRTLALTFILSLFNATKTSSNSSIEKEFQEFTTKHQAALQNTTTSTNDYSEEIATTLNAFLCKSIQFHAPQVTQEVLRYRPFYRLKTIDSNECPIWITAIIYQNSQSLSAINQTLQSLERIKILRQQIIYAFATIIKKTPIGTVDPIDIDPKDYPWAKRSIPTFFSSYKGEKNPLPTEKFVDYPTSSDGVFTPRIIFRPTEDILSGTLQTITDGLMDKQRKIYDSNIARIKEQRREKFKKLLRNTSIATACIVGCCFLFKKLR